MGAGSGLYMYNVLKRSRSLSHLLMSSCLDMRAQRQANRQTNKQKVITDTLIAILCSHLPGAK